MVGGDVSRKERYVLCCRLETEKKAAAATTFSSLTTTGWKEQS